MNDFLKKYKDDIRGAISCYDRIIVRGTLATCCYSQGMTSWLYSKGIKIFDYPKYAQTLRDKICTNAKKIAIKNNISIEFISKTSVKKEAIVQKIIEKRGEHPGLVHIISVMETCTAYKLKYKNDYPCLIGTTGKCLHYYFYFIDKDFGLCYLRVPTWCPFTLQFYCNGHRYLANKLQKKKIAFEMIDNAFVFIDDYKKAQQLSDQLEVAKMHAMLNKWSNYFCPVLNELQTKIHWSGSQIEYATDIIFEQRERLEKIYENMIQIAVCSIKSHNISRFLGKRLHGNYQDEIGSNLSTRVEGKRIKHVMLNQNVR